MKALALATLAVLVSAGAAIARRQWIKAVDEIEDDGPVDRGGRPDTSWP